MGIHPLNCIPGLQGVTSEKEVFEPGKEDDVHFAGDRKTVPVVITWLFGLLKPQFPQSKPLMCFRQSIWWMADHNEIAVRAVQFGKQDRPKCNLFANQENNYLYRNLFRMRHSLLLIPGVLPIFYRFHYNFVAPLLSLFLLFKPAAEPGKCYNSKL